MHATHATRVIARSARPAAPRPSARLFSRVRIAGSCLPLFAHLYACAPNESAEPCRSAEQAGCTPPSLDAAQDSARAEDAEVADVRVVDARPGAGPDAGRTPVPDAGAAAEDAAGPDAEAPPPDDAGPPEALSLAGDLGVHDPAIIEAGGEYFIFSTGPGIGIKRSADLRRWRDAGRVFSANPPWIATSVPGATDLWAPDIAFFAGSYHLYYSVSTFGSNQSCIGHAVASDLANGGFRDLGPVVCSRSTDDWNAIDPNFFLDEAGQPWLTLGSFWSGIKLIRLDGMGARSGRELHALASRENTEIEAPYVVHRGGYYYLFVSFDRCCRGADSTYRIMVGRAESMLGPYLDAEGKSMLAGGGTQLVAGDGRWRGPGHNSVLISGPDAYLVYHAYDAQRDGAPTLRILELHWDAAGWPIAGGP